MSGGCWVYPVVVGNKRPAGTSGDGAGGIVGPGLGWRGVPDRQTWAIVIGSQIVQWTAVNTISRPVRSG